MRRAHSKDAFVAPGPLPDDVGAFVPRTERAALFRSHEMALVQTGFSGSRSPDTEMQVELQALWRCMERLTDSVAALEAQVAEVSIHAFDKCRPDALPGEPSGLTSQGSTAPGDLPHLCDLVDGTVSQAEDFSDGWGRAASGLGSSRCSITGALDSSRVSSARTSIHCGTAGILAATNVAIARRGNALNRRGACSYRTASRPRYSTQDVGTARQYDRHGEDIQQSNGGVQPPTLTHRSNSEDSEGNTSVIAGGVAAEEDSDSSSQGAPLRAMRERLLSIRASLLRKDEHQTSNQSFLETQSAAMLESPLRPVRMFGALDNRSPLNLEQGGFAASASPNVASIDKENIAYSANSRVGGLGCPLKLEVEKLSASAAVAAPLSEGRGSTNSSDSLSDERVPQERPHVEAPPASAIGAFPSDSGVGISGGGVLCGGRKNNPPRWWTPALWLSPEDGANVQPCREDPEAGLRHEAFRHASEEPQVPKERPALQSTQPLARPVVLQTRR